MDSISEGQVRPILLSRRLTAEDVLAVQTLAARSFPDAWRAGDFRFFVENRCGVCVGMFSEEGLLRAYFLGLLVDGTLDIISLAVDPDLRRRGLGERLMQEVRATEGVTRVTLEVDTANLAAHALYTKLGFATQSIRKGYYQGKHDAYFMLWVK